MEVELFNEYGYYIYYEYDLTMTFKNDNSVAINNEIIFISYLSEQPLFVSKQKHVIFYVFF